MKQLCLVNCLMMAFLWNCANPVAPTGGPEDLQPPKLVQIDPENESTDFGTRQIEIRFDEYIKLVDQGSITLSPPADQELEFKVRGKRLMVTLPDSLSPQTTYSIDFGLSIQDLNRGNILKNFVYAFSTGPELDSLRFRGEVVDAFSGGNVADILVMMYLPGEADSAIFQARPRYLARTNDDGQFIFQYLKEGDYHLVALRDANLNLKRDVGEAIAFSGAFARVDSSAFQQKRLRLFEEFEPLRIAGATFDGSGKITVALSRPSSSSKVGFSSNLVCVTNTITQDTITGWSAIATDSGLVHLFEASELMDSTEVTARSEKEFEASILPGLQDLILATTAPCSRWPDSLKVASDSLGALGSRAVEGDSCSTRFLIAGDWHTGVEYEIQIPGGAFVSIYQDSIAEQTFEFTKRPGVEMGQAVITLDLTDSLSQYILQILRSGKSSSVVKSYNASAGSSHTFTQDLPLGNYKLRLIKDENGNGIWDPGSFEERVQPESVLNYSQRLEIKPGWLQEIELGAAKTKLTDEQ